MRGIAAVGVDKIRDCGVGDGVAIWITRIWLSLRENLERLLRRLNLLGCAGQSGETRKFFLRHIYLRA